MPPVSRRFVLTGAAIAATSLVIPVVVAPIRATDRKGGADYEITDWIVIASSGLVTLGLSQPEVGQGSYTALPQILADELDADWDRVKIRFVTGRQAYKIAFRQEAPVQKEGASMSTTVLYERLRTAGAAAREVLIRAAAQTWSIDAAAVPHRERLRHQRRAARRLSYGQLAPAAAKLPLSAAPPLKDTQPVSPDRQAGRATGYAGQVQRQRDLRHRRRRPRHAQRRHHDGAVLHRTGDRDQERSATSSRCPACAPW